MTSIASPPRLPPHPVPRGLEGLCAGCGRLSAPGEIEACAECGLPVGHTLWRGGNDDTVGCALMSLAPLALFGLAAASAIHSHTGWVEAFGFWLALMLLLPAVLGALACAFMVREGWRNWRRKRSSRHLARHRPPSSDEAIEADRMSYPLMAGAVVDAKKRLLYASGVSCWPSPPLTPVDPGTLAPGRITVLEGLARLEAHAMLQVHHGPQRQWLRRTELATEDTPGGYRSGGARGAWECTHLDGAYVHIGLPLSSIPTLATPLEDALGAPLRGAYELAPLVEWLSADPGRLEYLAAMVGAERHDHEEPHAQSTPVRPRSRDIHVRYAPKSTPRHLPSVSHDEMAPKGEAQVQRRVGELAAMLTLGELATMMSS